MLEIWAEETLPCLCGKGSVQYEMCENENLLVFGTMNLLCPYCSEIYKIEFDESKTPFEERTFYLVPKNKSIHGGDRYSVLKESICIPTPNF